MSAVTGRHLGVAAPIIAGVIAAAFPAVARATDPFEIQVYDGTANKPGVFALELHANSVIRGLRDSTLSAPPPEAPQDRQTHFTFEPQIGVTDFWEVGGYFQTAILPDSTFYYAGIKLRSKFVSPPSLSKELRFGVNFELSLLPEKFDRDKWGSEIRPMFAWETRSFQLAVNPIIDTSLAGQDRHEGPTFQPAAEALVKWEDRASIGVEYYANIGPFKKPLPLREEEQYVFEVANVLALPRWELNLGVGQGLTDGSNTFIAKTIIGYAWEKPAPRPHP